MPGINFDNHFRDLFENSHDLIYFLKIDGEIELANPAWLSTLGYQLDEVVGKNIYDFIHPDSKEKYRNNRIDVITNNKIKAVEVAFLTRENQIILGEGQVGCSYKNGKPQYTRCVFKNTTLSQQAEKIVRESEKRLKAFIKSGPDAVIIINENQEILEWNPRTEAIFGFTATEVTGKTLTQTIIPPKYRDAHLRGMKHFINTGEGPILNKTVEITALHKNGKEFHINLSISNVKIDQHWLFIAFLSDISERKKTEEALIRKEAELMQSRSLEEEKDKFITIASHELRTPITTIKAYTQLTLSMYQEGNEVIKKYLTKIDQSTSKLNFLLNELLDVSKINLGKLNLSKSEFDLHIFLADILNSIQQITATHKVILEQNDAVLVKAEPVRLEQVIINLVSNAAKYSPGKEQIIVRSFLHQQQVIISVSDYGIGISSANIELIFNRFFRVNDSSAQFSGFGIGLYVSSEIVKQHGGKMWVESVEGEGSTFYFSLPV